jgi:hypothetical protein
MNLCIALAITAILAAAPCAAQVLNPAAVDSATATALPVMMQAPIPSAEIPTPPDFPRGRLSGYLFGDAYYNAAGDPVHAYSATGADAGQTNIDATKPITRDLNGLQVRRVYFQVDNDLSIRYSTRLRLEMDGKAFTADGKTAPYVKNAYFQAKSVVPRGDFLFGMLNTPTWETAEEFWQYRAIDKTLADFRGIGSASDLGVALRGFADGDHHLGYAAMIGDGNGQKPETDRYKKFYLAAPTRFGDLRFEPYVDYQALRVNLLPKVATHADSAAANYDQATYKVFTGYEFRKLAIGVEGVMRVNHQGPAANQEPRGASVFARGLMTPTLAAFARFDQWQPDSRAANRVDSRLWIVGVDWQPLRDVHVMPNIETTQYLARGTAVAPAHHDLQARVTFFCRFSRSQS